MAATKTFGDIGIDYGDDNYSFIGGLMADRWWVNDEADNDWENANNWSTAEGGVGGAGIPTSLDNVYFSDTSSPDNCNLSTNALCLLLATNSVVSGGTDDWSGSLTIGTFNLVNSGLTTMSAILIMGVSAGTGLTTVGLSFLSGSSADLQTTSKIATSNGISIHDSSIWSNHTRGILHFTGDGNCSNVNGANSFYEYKVFAGVTLTIADSFRTTSSSGNRWEQNGIADLQLSATYFCAGSATSNVIFGASSNIIGSTGHVWCTIRDGANVQMLKTDTFTYSGTFTFSISADNINALSGDFRNAKYRVWKSTSDLAICYFESGTIRCRDLEVGSNGTNTININTVRENPDIVIYGNVDLNGDVGVFTTNWIKGTGTITINGTTTSTIDFNDKAVEDITVNTTSTKEMKGDIQQNKITGIQGRIIADTLGSVYQIKAI